VNVVVVGAGRIGRLHAEHLTFRVPGTRLVGIADVNRDAAQSLADRLGVARVSTDYRDLVTAPDVDAVIICSATDTHTEVILESARAGKHIFCEKPIDLDLGRIDSALYAVADAGVLLQIGFNRRFDANFARVRRGIAANEIGTPHLLHIMSRDPAPPPISYVRVSGGIFVDMMIHDFDMARFLVGSEIQSVFATAGVFIDPAIGDAGDVDTAVVVLTFENGVIGTIDNSRQAVYGYDQRVEVFGSGGSITALNEYPNQVQVSTAQTVYRDLPLHFFLERYAESYVAEMLAFVDAVRTGSPVPVTGHDGKQALLAGLAAGQSLKQGRPVALSEIEHEAED